MNSLLPSNAPAKDRTEVEQPPLFLIAAVRRAVALFDFYPRTHRWLNRGLVFTQLYLCYYSFFFLRHELLTSFCSTRIVLSSWFLDVFTSMPVGLSQRPIFVGIIDGQARYESGHFDEWVQFVGEFSCVSSKWH